MHPTQIFIRFCCACLVLIALIWATADPQPQEHHGPVQTHVTSHGTTYNGKETP